MLTKEILGIKGIGLEKNVFKFFTLQKPFDLKNKKKTMPISIIGNIKSKDSFGVFKTLIIELR